MATVWAAIVVEYRRHRVSQQYNNLNIGSFCTAATPFSAYPKLKGRGAEVRDLVLPLSVVWRSLMKDSARNRRVADVFDTQVQMQTMLHDHAHEVFLPPAKAKKFTQLVYSYLKEYSKLANEADKDKELLFSMVIKFHYLHHMGSRAPFLNPRKGNTMIDEDFVGKCKDIVAACAHGTEAHAVPEKFMERYIWGKWIVMTYGP